MPRSVRFLPILSLLLAVAAVQGAAAAPEALPAQTPHGVLLDRTLPLAHLEDLAGTAAAAPAVDLARWRQAVHELRRAAESPLAWPAPRDLAAAARARHPRATIPLGLVHAVVDRLDPAGAPTTARVFTLAALRPVTHHGAAVEFVLDPADLLVHGAPLPVRLRLDADDGRGWRALVPGRPLAVSYGATGPRTLRLAAELPDGTVLSAAARLDVARLDTPAPTATWAVTASESWGGVAASGQAYLYLAAGRTTPENPVVVIEGFDLDDTMDWPVLYDLLNQESLIEELRALGYDAVVLDFDEATAPLQRNGLLVAELLTRVRAAAGPEATAVLIGASMGGLLSRFALAHLEDAGADPGVRTFISFDAPQAGANIPLGLQHWLDFFRDESEAAAFLLSRLDTPAARQMLLYHHTVGGANPGADPSRAAFLADLAARGDWPAGPRLVAVANGSGTGQGQGFAAGAQIIRYVYRNWLVDIDGNVWAVPDASPTTTIFDGMINRIWPLSDDYQTVTVGGTLPWDNAPGGLRASMAQMDTTAVPYGDIEAVHPAHCFIPTISALALATSDPFFVPANAPDAAALSPFDALYWPDANQEHIAIDAAGKAWFLAEITAGPSAAPGELPDRTAAIRLLPPAPNPFNPRTRLRFELARSGPVDLAVYDVAGRRVRTLATGAAWPAGPHEVVWDGRGDAGAPAAAGRYLARLVAGGEATAVGLTLVK